MFKKLLLSVLVLISAINPIANAATKVPAKDVTVNTTTFNHNLGPGDVDVQTALSTIDDLVTGGITSLNGLTGATQTFATGSTGTDFGISSSGTVHTFNIPTASAANRGLLSSTDWSIFNSKQGTITAGTGLTFAGSTLNSVWTTSGNDISNNNSGTVTSLGNFIINKSSPMFSMTNPLGLDAFSFLDMNGFMTFSFSDGVNNGTLIWSSGTFAFNEPLSATNYTSTVATGTAPLTVASTTKVTNLNVDQTDGFSLNQDVTSAGSPSFVRATFTQTTGTSPFTVSSTTQVTNLNASQLVGSTWVAPGTIGSTTPSSGAFTTVSSTGQITSTLATGTSPLVIASTTQVSNLNVSQLVGSTWIAPGTIGSTTPSSGAFTTLSATGQITSTLATGTAPLVIASTTQVSNLNVSQLIGGTWAVPGTIGSTTKNTGAFTTLSATGQFTSSVSTGSAPFVVASTTNVANLNASTLTGNAVGTSGATIPLLNGTNTWSGVQLFTDTDLTLRNPANTFTTVLSSGAITAGRTVTLPNATTTLAGLSQSNTFTGATQTISTASASILALTNTGTPMTFQWNLTSGVLTLKDVTNSFTLMTVDPVGVGDDITFNGTNGTSFQFGGNTSVSFQATTFFFTASNHSSNFRFDFGTAGQFDTYVDSTQMTRLTTTGFSTVGTLTSSRSTDLGWSVQAATNQACNTTCTSACVVGFNVTAGNITGLPLACTDATADSCICAGAS